MKHLLAVVLLLVIAVATVSLWGGCDLEYKVRNIWCGIRHIDSDAAELSCKARAIANRAGCFAEHGVESGEISL